MKRYFSIIILALAAVSACEQAGSSSTESYIYPGKQAVFTVPSEKIPVEGGSITMDVAVDFESFTVSLPTTVKWLTATVISNGTTTVKRMNEAREEYEVELPAFKVIFTAGENTGADRYASVAFVDPKGMVFTRFDISQSGTEKDAPHVVYKAFSVSPESIPVPHDATSAVITVTADDVAWTAVSDNAAFVPSLSSGTGNASITVSFPANEVNSEVSAVITVSTTSDEVRVNSYKVTITQEAAPVKLPAIKPAPGTVLAEWHFCTAEVSVLKTHFDEATADAGSDSPGNGGRYIEPNVGGKGRLEYFNGCDKAAEGIVDQPNKRCRRYIGSYGEPLVYGTYKGDWYTWTAYTDSGAPIAAGTKLHIFYVVRPHQAGVMKYWLLEYLDGDEWKPAMETKEKDGVIHNIELFYTSEQVQTEIEATVTLAKDTDCAIFRATAVSNHRASDGTVLEKISAAYCHRFVGEDSSDANAHFSVKRHPMIDVVE